MTGWCEGCPCHGDELLHDRRSRKRPRLATSATIRPCPMKGKNLVELVGGKLRSECLKFAQLIALDLATDIQSFMSPEHWGVISRDLIHATSAMRAGLEVKFDWTNRLPWSLARLASLDVSEARECGRVASLFYDGQTQESIKNTRGPGLWEVCMRGVSPEGANGRNHIWRLGSSYIQSLLDFCSGSWHWFASD